MQTCPKNTRNGFTLLEVLVAVAMLGIVFASISVILDIILKEIGQSRVRSVALSIIQDRMERIRNLAYQEIGTVEGIPPGLLDQSETVNINGQQFLITTSIIYIDDPYDNQSPSDTRNTDYKRVRIEANWGGLFPSKIPISLVTNVVPKGREDQLAGGTIRVTVFNASGVPISSATVTIQAPLLVPPVNITTITDTEGMVEIPGSPVCAGCYRITVSKNGYSSDRTYSTEEVANPILPDLSITDGNISSVSFAIDKIGKIIVSSYDQTYKPVAYVIFTLKGSKIIGYDSVDNPVYKYSYVTNTGGFTVQIPNLEWDSYSLDLTNSSYTLAGANPPLPAKLNPEATLNLPIVVAPKASASFLLSVRNGLGIPLASASAALSNISTGYISTDVTSATGAADFGYAFFPSLATGLYDLSVNLPGYLEATSSVQIDGNNNQTILLDPI